MVTDRQITFGNQVKSKVNAKAWKFDGNDFIYPHPFVLGFSGELGEVMELVDFFSHPENFKSAPRMRSSTGLALTKEGIYIINSPGRWVRLKEKYYAIGSGSIAALGALHAGASPKEAVLAASKVDPFTGMGTKSIKL